MQLPRPRGPLSSEVVDELRGEPRTASRPPAGGRHAGTTTAGREAVRDVLADDDLQVALWTLYELHYRGFEDVADAREWDPELLRLRARLEERLERELRDRTADAVARAVDSSGDVAERLVELVESADGPPVAGYLQREATREQVVEFLRQRSIYHLKESDPYSFVLSRLDGPPKVALAELQYDEFGAGRPERLHQTMFGDALEGSGLDRRPGAYLAQATAETLATSNVASLFALNRRLRGAAMGHFAAFESTSSVPCRKIARGITRVGLPDVVAAYFEEHVEADAVHEQVAVRHICGRLAEQEPQLTEDVFFGAASCLLVDAVAGERLLRTWQADSPYAGTESVTATEGGAA